MHPARTLAGLTATTVLLLARLAVADERHSLLPSYVLGGVGGLGAASFAYFGLSGNAGYDGLNHFLFRAGHEQPARTGGLSFDIAAAPQAAGLSVRLIR